MHILLDLKRSGTHFYSTAGCALSSEHIVRCGIEHWGHHTNAPNTPEGFTLRTTYPTNPNGVEVMLEQWEAGSAEPPHSHPGDDMTVVIEGKMPMQFFTKSGKDLVPDGEPMILNKGDAGYIKAGRIHNAKYIEPCKLVYVHDKAFWFVVEG